MRTSIPWAFWAYYAGQVRRATINHKVSPSIALTPARFLSTSPTAPQTLMRKLLKRLQPHADRMLAHAWLRPLRGVLGHSALWHPSRKRLAGGVAVGLFAGLIPGPLQMAGGAVLAVLLRVNLPMAMVTTLYTNPFTILPLYALAAAYGGWAVGEMPAVSPPTLSPLDPNMASALAQWMGDLGKPLLVGLPLLGVTLAVVGYFVTLWGWNLSVIVRRKWRTLSVYQK
jgi:uncharacterized protein